MKAIITTLFLCLSVVAMAQKKKKTIKVEIEIEHVKSDRGHWMLAVYNEDADFLSMKPTYAKCQKVGENNNVIALDIPKGKYAIAVYQDINSNQNLERDSHGIPIEPYSFTGGNIFPLTDVPTFEKCKVKVSQKSSSFQIPLQQSF